MKLRKKIFAGAFAATLTMGMATTAFAGTWQTGSGADQGKWWYDNGDGTYAQDGWRWIDGNQDGTAECYYFDGAGWLLADTTTPDGYTVNANGAWMENGVVQTKQNQTAQDSQAGQNTQEANQGAQPAAGQGTYYAGQYDAVGNWAENVDVMYSDWGDYFTVYQENEWYDSDMSLMEKISEWGKLSERGAHWNAAFAAYGIPCQEILDQIEATQGSQATITFTTTVGIPSEAIPDMESVVGMLIMLRTDGMGECTFSTSQGTAGGPATVTIDFKMMG